MLTTYWPLRGLRLTTPALELRLPTEEELAELADLAAHGVHRPEERPFLTPWTDGSPAERARFVLQQHWQRLGNWSPQDWALDLAVFHERRPVGMQDVRAQDFAVRREVSTGSWLGLGHQGQGFGTEMRAAVLHLAFAGLGCLEATTMSFVDNAAPLRISRKLGYRPDGITRDVLDGQTVVSQRLRLSRKEWELTDRLPVTVSGLHDCLDMFGVKQ
ncbi:GNAT family protein [Actinomadura sp. B10D3]|uniref:GNAT family N-acetyltransferase n=1 Tax=Actinomadura sp. B10D3 TaxID=3153557 RepID=UPI00325DBC3D